jgi:hypothetical protein
MSGTVFVEAGAGVAAEAPPESDAAGVAEAVVGVAPVLVAGVSPGDPVAAEFDVPELAGAPVPVEVPDGVHAAEAARARRGRANEREVLISRAWDDTSAGGVKEESASRRRTERDVPPAPPRSARSSGRSTGGSARRSPPSEAPSPELSFRRHTRRRQDHGARRLPIRQIALRT